MGKNRCTHRQNCTSYRFHGSYPGALEKEIVTHSSTLAWKKPWMKEPGRLLVGPWSLKESDTTWATSLTTLVPGLWSQPPSILWILVLFNSGPSSPLQFSVSSFIPWYWKSGHPKATLSPEHLSLNLTFLVSNKGLAHTTSSLWGGGPTASTVEDSASSPTCTSFSVPPLNS